jgi:glutamate transport system permease protein
VVQPLGSLFIALTKNTSVATVIGVPEIIYRTDSLNTSLSEPLWLFAGAGVAYLILTLPSGLVVGWIERRVAIVR